MHFPRSPQQNLEPVEPLLARLSALFQLRWQERALEATDTGDGHG
jgi:hypothetical protein